MPKMHVTSWPFGREEVQVCSYECVGFPPPTGTAYAFMTYGRGIYHRTTIDCHMPHTYRQRKHVALSKNVPGNRVSVDVETIPCAILAFPDGEVCYDCLSIASQIVQRCHDTTASLIGITTDISKTEVKFVLQLCEILLYTARYYCDLFRTQVS